VEPTAYIQGPCVIGPGAEIRHGAYIRGHAWIGAKAVVGHTTEVKGAVFFDNAKAGHFAYVGDSLLGQNVNLGAGTKLANLKLKGDEVRVKHPLSGELIRTGLRKFSAIIGDNAQTGCNSVLSPGTLLLPNTAVLPCVHYLGTLTKGFAR
jgi:NDP-sugar pyrophosphorylase family protein